MTIKGRITTAFPVPAIRLQTLVRSRTAAVVAILAINILGISAPIVAHAAVVYPLCTAASPVPEVSPNGCLFGPPFPGFEMDGNTPVDTANGVDWDTNPFPYPRTDFNLTQNEIDLVQGSKYLQQSSWSCSTNDVTPQKVELLSGATAINTFTNGHQVGFFNFTREAPNGDAFIDYVFSRGAPPASAGCPQLPARQSGDVVVTFTLTNGGSAVAIDLARWNGTGFDSIGSGSHGVDWMAAESAGGTFFEGGVDFTNVFFNGSGGFTCHAFASVYMDSRSSGSGGTSEMKDVSGLALPPLCKNPTVATQSSATGSSVAAGTVVHDTATVTGVAGSGTPTGSVDFHLCGPLASASGCTTGGTDIGSTSTNVSGTDGSGNPTATYTSANTLPVDAIGTYCWRADYTAALDGNYTNATGPIDAAHECFTVVGATTTATSSSVTGAQLPGVSATDTATVTLNSPATGPAPTGTVTFKLCDPSAVCTQVGSPVALASGSATSAAVNGTTTPNTLAIGKYCWEATYNATGNYTGSSELSHPNAECFTTGKNPTTTTTSVLSQTVDVSSNSATVGDTSSTPVSVPSGVTFTPGTVTFRLYGPSAQSNCDTTPVYTSSAIAGTYASGNATQPNTGNVTASTGNISLAAAGITKSGTYWWVATYSGDDFNLGSHSGCGEEPINAVDASIKITPTTAVNEVGTEHVFTITLTAIPAGTTPSGFSITPSINSKTGLTTNSNTCGSLTFVDANTRSCTYTINTNTAGTYTLDATGSVTMGGVTVTRSTSGNAGPGGSGPATKHYVDALITITPQTAVNEVGSAHVFTITLTAIPDDAGAPSNFSITPSLNPLTELTTNTNTCASLTVVDANTRSCTYTINTNKAGTYTLDASGSVTMGGVTVTRSTSGNAGPGGSGPATKHYVDASIAITPTEATNVIKHQHVFTITLTAIPDDAGAPSDFTITPSLIPTTNLTTNSNTCATPNVSSNTATCTYTINSSAEGTYTLNATGSVTMGGVTVTRSTSGNSGPGGSGPAVKHYVAPNSSLVKAERDVTTPDLTQNGGGFTAGPITAHPLDVLEYRLTYANSGHGAASHVTVTDVVPVAHSAYVSASCTGGISCSYDSLSHTLTWDLGTVNGGGTQVVMTFQIKLTNDFPAGATTQISNAAVVTTFEEGSLPSNTVVANVFVPVQQVLGAAVTLPKAGWGPLQQIFGQSGNGGVIAFAGTLLLAMLCVVAYESLRRKPVEGDEV
jgi:hypothetical protein